MIIRRIARPLLATAFIGQGVETLLNIDSGAEAVRPALDGLKDMPDPVARNVPSNAVAVAQATAAAQVVRWAAAGHRTHSARGLRSARGDGDSRESRSPHVLGRGRPGG